MGGRGDQCRATLDTERRPPPIDGLLRWTDLSRDASGEFHRSLYLQIRSTASENIDYLRQWFRSSHVRPDDLLRTSAARRRDRRKCVFARSSTSSWIDLIDILVSPDRVSLGCLKDDQRLHEYIIPETYDDWRQCREECNNRRMKVSSRSLRLLHLLLLGVDCLSFRAEKRSMRMHSRLLRIRSVLRIREEMPMSTTRFSIEQNVFGWWTLADHLRLERHRSDRYRSRYVIAQNRCFSEWHERRCLSGLEIRMADASSLAQSRTRVQINEGVEIIVSVKNERNLASLTVYGDIEGQDGANTNVSSNEIYIIAGVVSPVDSCSMLVMFQLPCPGQSVVEEWRIEESAVPCGLPSHGEQWNGWIPDCLRRCGLHQNRLTLAIRSSLPGQSWWTHLSELHRANLR